MENVPPVSAMLSDEARRGLRRFCSEHGVTLTGLFEAAGLILDERGTLEVDALVARARQVDEGRRAR